MFIHWDMFRVKDCGTGKFVLPENYFMIFQEVFSKKGLKTKNNSDLKEITKGLFLDKLKESDINFVNFIYDAISIKIVDVDNLIYSLIKKYFDISITKFKPNNVDWSRRYFANARSIAKKNYKIYVDENAYIDNLLDNFADYKPFIDSDITMKDLFDEFCDLLYEVYLDKIEFYNVHYGASLSVSPNCWFMHEKTLENFKKVFKSYLIEIVLKSFDYMNDDDFMRLYNKKIDLLLKELNLSLKDAFEYLKKFVNPIVDIYQPSFELNAQYNVDSTDAVIKFLSKIAYKENGKKYTIDEVIEFLITQDSVSWQQDGVLYSDMEELDSVINEDYYSIYCDTYYQPLPNATLRKGY